jgi:hypothetical protein
VFRDQRVQKKNPKPEYARLGPRTYGPVLILRRNDFLFASATINCSMKFASDRFSCRALRSTKAFTLGFIRMSNVVVFCSRTGLFIHFPIETM